MPEDVLHTGTEAVAAMIVSALASDEPILFGWRHGALHLGHRQSRILDFFTRSPTDTLPLLAHVQWNLIVEQIQWQLDDVSVTLLAYPFSHHFAYHSWRGLAVADAWDVACARDYLDRHPVLTRQILSLDDLMHLARRHLSRCVFPGFVPPAIDRYDPAIV